MADAPHTPDNPPTASRRGALQLFAPQASAAYGARVAGALERSLSPLEEREFEDGEHKIRPLDNVRGADVFVLQQLHGEPGH